MCAVTHAAAACGIFCAAPCGAAKRVRVCQRGRGHACGRGNSGIRLSSPWGHETCEGCAKLCAVTHAIAATGAFGGLTCGATERVRGVPTCARSHMRSRPLWPSVGPLQGSEACAGGVPTMWLPRRSRPLRLPVELPMQPRSVRGVPKRVRPRSMWPRPLGPSVELPLRSRYVSGYANSAQSHMRWRPWGPSVELMGCHETCEGAPK